MLDVGGREVVLRFLGRGHTDHDLVVEVETPDDATVVFAGDLVEEGAPRRSRTRPGGVAGDARPAARAGPRPGRAGHGEVVDAAFVGAQREELLAVLAAVRAGRLDDGPYDPATMRTAGRRGLR